MNISIVLSTQHTQFQAATLSGALETQTDRSEAKITYIA